MHYIMPNLNKTFSNGFFNIIYFKFCEIMTMLVRHNQQEKCLPYQILES